MVTNSLTREITQLHANICSGLADPRRILILYTLKDKPINVSDLANEVGISQPAASRHLTILRERGMVTAERDGQSVVYTLADERIIQVGPWDITQLCDDPERARLVGAVYWEGRLISNPTGPLIKVMVGEDWIVQRDPGSGLKIVLYVNSYHRVLPGSSPLPSFS